MFLRGEKLDRKPQRRIFPYSEPEKKVIGNLLHRPCKIKEKRKKKKTTTQNIHTKENAKTSPHKYT